MSMTEYQPGERAPAAGSYEQLNIFGSRTGTVVTMLAHGLLPGAPRGFTWRLLPDRPPADVHRLDALPSGTAPAAAPTQGGPVDRATRFRAFALARPDGWDTAA